MPCSFKVMIAEGFVDDAVKVLEGFAEVKLTPPKVTLSEDDLIRELADCDAVIISSRTGISRRVIKASTKLRVISKFGAKPDNVDFQAAAERGIRVLWTPLSNPDSVAEFTVLLMLALLRKLARGVAILKQGKWRNDVEQTSDILGRTVGLVGLGNVGIGVAKRVRSFQTRVIAFDPFVSPDFAKEAEVELVDFAALLRKSDVLSLHATLTPETRHMIGYPQFQSMKKGAILINTARGGLVDETALLRALKEGLIAGAGLDVFEVEPPSADSPLLAMDNVIATPHIAARTHDTVCRERTWAAEDVKRVLRGEEPIHC
jgi:D-3-phosphoglycerate dehydrogenase